MNLYYVAVAILAITTCTLIPFAVIPKKCPASPEPLSCPEPTPAPTAVCPEVPTCTCTMAPTTSPTAASTCTCSSAPVSSTFAPTVAPVLPPTSAPTVAIQCPTTLSCADEARQILVNGLALAGSTVGATSSIREKDTLYTFMGTGGLVQVSACSNTTASKHSFVLQSPVCIPDGFEGLDFGETSTDNLNLCDSSNRGSSIEFESRLGETYYVSVYPSDPANPGDFTIQLTSTDNPINDDSGDSIPLYINSETFVLGTTMNATKQGANNDVWYHFTGNGKRVRVTTCSDDTTTAHNFLFFKTYPENYNYDFGSTTTNNNMCDDHVEAAVYEFDSNAGTTYYIRVSPRSSGVVGQFAIAISDYEPPANDNSGAAVPLYINSATFMVGTTINATNQGVANDVWYHFTGNGKRVRVTSCSEHTTTAHNFLLFKSYPENYNYDFGSTTTNNNMCDDYVEAAVYEFDSAASTTYYIRVSPRSASVVGQFALALSDYEPPANDHSDYAVPLYINSGTFVVGTTVNATIQGVAYDVWYYFTGNGNRVRVTTCSDDTTMAHNFLLFKSYPENYNYDFGSTTTNNNMCDDHVEAAVYEFDSESGTKYYIRMSPRTSNKVGQFAVALSDYDPPANDHSNYAVPLNVNTGTFVVGTTVNATKQGVANDVWYYFTGNGKRVRVTTCSEDTTTAHDFLLFKSYPENYNYDFGSTTTNNNLCDDHVEASVYEFDSESGTTYYIRVAPRSSGVWGQFAIAAQNAPTSAPTASPGV